MKKRLLLTALALLLVGIFQWGQCQTSFLIHPAGKTIATRVETPLGFQRVAVRRNSFADYLRHLPLKPNGAQVHLYDGSIKPADGVYMAVVDLPIGHKNLHQCADAVIHLRADYLWKHKQFNKIHFNFTSGFRADYSRWQRGNRIVVRGNHVHWVHSAQPSSSYATFWKYLETVFTYAGTLSLSSELIPVSIDKLKIGDVFIQGGSPGHAVIVVDLAQNPETGEKIFLLAQSYMPAQEIQILQNPNNPQLSPWYSARFGNILQTPEWTFTRRNLKRFRGE